MKQLEIPSPFQKLVDPLFKTKNLTIYLKRDDLIHPHISGNKWRKLQYNIQAAKAQGKDTLLTFGGAFSNHISATAAAGAYFGFKTIGIIRGESHDPPNFVLQKAKDFGMELHHISRSTYRQKNTPEFLKQIRQQFGDYYLIPEGGSNLMGVKGCIAIPQEITIPLDYLCCSCGTGTMMAGIILGAAPNTQILGFSALKGGDFLHKDITNLIRNFQKTQETLSNTLPSWQVILDYHFGGYAKKTNALVDFIKNFYQKNKIELDFVYNGKMIYAIFDLIQKDYFKAGSTIGIVHCGGLPNGSVFPSSSSIT